MTAKISSILIPYMDWQPHTKWLVLEDSFHYPLPQKAPPISSPANFHCQIFSIGYPQIWATMFSFQILWWTWDPLHSKGSGLQQCLKWHMQNLARNSHKFLGRWHLVVFMTRALLRHLKSITWKSSILTDWYWLGGMEEDKLACLLSGLSLKAE